MNLTGRPIYLKVAKKRKKESDRDYLDWLSYQPSCIDGSWNQWDNEKGEGRNISCHVRRISGGAGLGKKPDYSAVPMSGDQHNTQSWYGESACLNKYAPKAKGLWSDLEAMEFFDEQAAKYLKMWKARTQRQCD